MSSRTPSGRRPTLLVVDDSRLILQMVADFFESREYRVVQADDGAVALERLEHVTPDVIVADILMPRVDGWELFETVRRRRATAETPFVFLTVERDLPSRLRGLQAGADDYLTKPFEVEELFARVERILRRVWHRRDGELADTLLSGSVEHLALADLLQILAMNARHCVVHLRDADRHGEIHFDHGQMVHACTGRARGLKALIRMLGWNRARFRVVPPSMSPEERSIDGVTPTVVMDGLVALDEWNRWRDGLPADGTRLYLSPDARTRLGEARVRPAEFEVMTRSKEGTSVFEILENSPLPDGQLAQAICHLIDRGVLTPAST